MADLTMAWSWARWSPDRPLSADIRTTSVGDCCIVGRSACSRWEPSVLEAPCLSFCLGLRGLRGLPVSIFDTVPGIFNEKGGDTGRRTTYSQTTNGLSRKKASASNLISRYWGGHRSLPDQVFDALIRNSPCFTKKHPTNCLPQTIAAGQ